MKALRHWVRAQVKRLANGVIDQRPIRHAIDELEVSDEEISRRLNAIRSQVEAQRRAERRRHHA